MPSWLLKSAVQHFIARLPQSHRVNEWFQERFTGSLELSRDTFNFYVGRCRRHLDNYRQQCPDRLDGFKVFELGTGWYANTAVGLYLCGAAEIWTMELAPRVNLPRTRLLLGYYVAAAESGELVKTLPWIRPERVARLKELLADESIRTGEELLGKLGIHAMVGDARHTGLPEGAVDLVFSTGVIEFIPRPVLMGILAEFHRILRPGGVMNHFIDLKDQFAHFDKSITPYNYLRFSSGVWRLLDSPLIPQTRLRLSDYRNLHESAGFTITSEENTSGPAEELRSITLAPEFRSYSFDDLLAYTSWMFSRRA